MMKRILFFCVSLALLFSAAGPRVLADDPNRLSQLRVSVWPEYDTPTVLVMFEGQFADTSAASREVSVLVPSKAKLHVATYANADGTLAREQPTQTSDLGDGYSRVTYTVPAANFWLEYYDDALQGNPDKTLDFSFKAPAPADQVTVEVQQPLKATNFTIAPATTSTRSENGFTYYDSTVSNVTAGQLISAQIKYTKTDPSPSVVAPPAAASLPAATPATSLSSTWNSGFVVVALVVLGLTSVLGFFMLQQQRARRLTPAMANNRNGRRAGKAIRGATYGVFCTQCGRALSKDDNFCPKCGAKRKVV